MWSYFGSKANVIDRYPKPRHPLIIEPFAGTARYALRYWDKEVIIVDKYPVVVAIWKWLQQCSVGDIMKLPRKLEPGLNLDTINFDCQEARWLMGFLCSKGVESPRRSVTKWVAIDRPNFANYLIIKIAANIHKIKHWDIRLGEYSDITNQNASWFIDPPYQFGGEEYVMSNKKIEYSQLGDWCKERMGQVIVCENTKATWMPFIPMVPNKSGRGIYKMEAIWTNFETEYHTVNRKLFDGI